MNNDTTYMAWREDEKNYPMHASLSEALDHYRQTRKAQPKVVLLHPDTAKAVQGTLSTVGIEIREVVFVQPNTIYVGEA